MADTAAISKIFKLVAREIWIVTASAGQQPADSQQRGGLVATWVSQASLDPQQPVVAIAIAANHHTREVIDASRAFAVHLLDDRSIDLAWRFGLQSGHEVDKYDGLDYAARTTGSPILPNCLAWLDCQAFARYDGGDRIYYWADVVSGQQERDGAPLTEHELLAAATDAQRAELKRGMLADIKIQAPRLAAWREELKRSAADGW